MRYNLESSQRPSRAVGGAGQRARVGLRTNIHDDRNGHMDDQFGLLWIHVGFAAIICFVAVLFVFN
jgi:hypothetical protein